MKKYIRAIEQVKKMSKHYCIFSAQYYPHVGGVERYTLYLSRKLIAAGNEVTIVTSNTGDLSGDEIQEGIQIYRLPCYDLLGGRYPVFKRNKEFKEEIQKQMRENFGSLAIEAQQKLKKLLNSKNENIQIQAIKDVLDRAGFKPVEKAEITAESKVELVDDVNE